MHIKDVLSELGKQMNIPNLKLDANKVCRLIFDKKYTVDIEASDDEKVVFLYSPLCSLPSGNREDAYEALLEANLFGRGTGGIAAFGVDKEMGEILLFSRIEMEKNDYQDFVKVLESFVNYVEAWTGRIEKGDFRGQNSQSETKTPAPKKPKDSLESIKIDDAPPPGYMSV